jgi:hypothetical protein
MTDASPGRKIIVAAVRAAAVVAVGRNGGADVAAVGEITRRSWRDTYSP